MLLRWIIKYLVMGLKFLLKHWRAHLRNIDKKIFWPACRNQADSIEHARDAFLEHARKDPAWRVLDEKDLLHQISELT